jgi:exopolysaccharide biosynthesis polyprenyl glycosylphosphotransferase
MAVRGKERGLLIPFLQVTSDIAAIECAFLFSFWLRFYSPFTTVLPVTKGIPSIEAYMWSSLAVIAVWLFIFQMNGLYGVRRNISRLNEISRIIKSVTIGMLIAMAGAFLYRGYSFSRVTFFLIWINSMVLMTVLRLMILYYERLRHRLKKDMVRAAIVGSSNWAGDILDTVTENPGLGIEISGYIGRNDFLAEKCRNLGSFEEIKEVIEKWNLDIVFLAPGQNDDQRFFDVLYICIGLDVEFYLLPDILDIMTSRLRVKELKNLTFLKIKESTIAGWNRVFKRAFDIVFSTVSLILLSPVFLLISVVVALSSGGSVFYHQKRIGRDGRRFDLIKFRSMRSGAERESGPVWTVHGDSRVTPAGRILRRFSMDELPQLLNVLRGEMSIVGPRPERPYFVDKFKDTVPKYLDRHRVKSGMTGWAQVNGLRGDTSIAERTKYDIYYIENWSLLFDIKIILMTIWAVLSGKESY